LNKGIVQLNFLQKSNEEQMDRLFALTKAELLVIHDYLQKSIFPKYMRSQQIKISASGQAIGSDMLIVKRVGYSGIPCDVLQKELGRCAYETEGDYDWDVMTIKRKVTMKPEK